MRAVTERDFRKPEFVDANPEDYEFRHDGKIVRKDRWQTSMTAVARLVMPLLNDGDDTFRDYELPDVVNAVRELVVDSVCWVAVAETDAPDLIDLSRRKQLVDLRLVDGSILRKAIRDEDGRWVWNIPHAGGQLFVVPVEWREAQDE